MELGKFPRVRFNFRAVSSALSLEGEGTVLTLSPKGCRVECATPIAPGTELAASLFMPDDQKPIELELATVRWTREGEFGLEFISMQAEQWERLRRFVRGLEKETEP